MTLLPESGHDPHSSNGGALQPAPSNVATSAEVATNIFLGDIKGRAEAAYAEAREETKSLKRKYSAVFIALLLSGALAVFLVAFGFVLLAVGAIPLAIVAEIVGLISGSGTAIFRQLARDITEQRRALGETTAVEAQLLHTVGVISMISDESGRNQALLALATRLTGGVGE